MESTHLLVFISRNLKTLLGVGFLAAVVASGVSLMMDEYYQSTVVMFATSQHSIGEQFFEETKKNDLLAYGETEDAERLLQILNSHRIRNRIIEKFDLFTHYNIDPSEPGAQADMALTYGSNVSANLTRFGSIKVSVLDTDPFLARDMANDMAHLVDSIANRMRNDRARDAYNLALSTLDQTTDQIAEAEDSLATLHSLGIYDFEAQVEGLTAQYGMALASNNGAAARTIRQGLGATRRLGQRVQQPLGVPRVGLRAEGLAPKAGGPDARRCRNAAAVQLCGRLRQRRRQEGQARALADRRHDRHRRRGCGLPGHARLGDLATRPSVQRLIPPRPCPS